MLKQIVGQIKRMKALIRDDDLKKAVEEARWMAGEAREARKKAATVGRKAR